MKRRPTREQLRQIWKYRNQGYTAFIFDEQGRIVPAYGDWVLQYILDELDFKELSGCDYISPTE